MCIVASDQLKFFKSLNLLKMLLKDRTTLSNIIWATNAYTVLGNDYQPESKITIWNLSRKAFSLKSRAEKAKEEQAVRTKAHAEVFTPMWIVKR